MIVTTSVRLPKTPFSDISEVDTESSALSRSCGPESTTVVGETLIPTSWCPAATFPLTLGTTALAREVRLAEIEMLMRTRSGVMPTSLSRLLWAS